MTHVPDVYVLLLLALAAFRLWRLLAWDIITRPVRERLLHRRDGGDVTDSSRYRPHVDEFVHCPWCLGAWLGIAWWIAWLVWPRATVAAAVPFAISAVLALVASNLDEE